jgi:hypothetical protein
MALTSPPTTGEPIDLAPIEPMVSTYVLHLELVQRMHQWAKRHGDILNPKRFGPTCMTMAMSAPWAPAASLELVARQAALIWAVDDELEVSLTEEEFLTKLDDTTAAVAGRPCRVDSAATDALAELRAELSAFPLFAELGEAWTEAMISGFSADLEGWRIAREMAGGAPPPSYDAYMAVATRSVHKTAMNLAMLIVTEHESLLEHWDRLAPAIDETNVAIRLVNDYGSYERENQTCDLNVRMLGISKEQLRHDIAASVERFREHLGPLLTTTNPLRAAVTLDRYLRTPIGFYLRFDYVSD